MDQSIGYTREVGRKFHPDGSARLFPGNTVICFAAASEPLYQAAVGLQDRLRTTSYGHRFALLPPPSFHMTVIELLCDQVREQGKWSAALPLDAPLPLTDAYFLERVPAVPAPSALRMRYGEVVCRFNLTINLAPADEAVAAALRAYREAVSDATQVRFPDFHSYQFHMSLGYRLIELTPDEQADLEQLIVDWQQNLAPAARTLNLPAPQLTFFDDMTRFVGADERNSLRSR